MEIKAGVHFGREPTALLCLLMFIGLVLILIYQHFMFHNFATGTFGGDSTSL